jgi:hypothetical protein
VAVLRSFGRNKALSKKPWNCWLVARNNFEAFTPWNSFASSANAVGFYFSRPNLTPLAPP